MGQVYKENANRSVWLDDSGPTPRVVKRFHHASPWRALRDPARARGEFDALRRLRGLGLPVPEPLELCLERGSVSLSMQAIPGAQSLEALLLGSAPPVPWPQLMRSLAALLARLQELRVVVPDLHPGNVLVDPRGQLFLVDLRGAKARSRAFSPSEELAALVAAEAEARDYLPARLRLCFVAAWQRATDRRRELNLAELERRGLVERRDYVEHGAGRWLRDSSRCEKNAEGVTTRFRCKWQPGFSRTSPRQAVELVTLEGAASSLRETWLIAARCAEHRLPMAWPTELELSGGRARASFALDTAPGVALRGPEECGQEYLSELFASRGLRLELEAQPALLECASGGFLLAPLQFPRERLGHLDLGR